MRRNLIQRQRSFFVDHRGDATLKLKRSTKVLYLFAFAFALGSPPELYGQFALIPSEKPEEFILSEPIVADNQMITEQLPDLYRIRNSIYQSQRELSRVLGANLELIPKISIVSGYSNNRVLGNFSKAAFSRGWYYFSTESLADIQEFHRTIRHETAHFAVYELSYGSCPAWMDEGLAQFFEGTNSHQQLLDERAGENLNITPHRLANLTLRELHDNLTLLEPERIPDAYAYSKLAVQSLINRYGMGAISQYLLGLRTREPSQNFFLSFGLTEEQFDSQLKRRLRNQ